MSLADRLAARMAPHDPRVQRMFGGTAFLVHENLVIGTMKDGLILRISAADVPQALENPFVSQMEMGGRVMAGWVLVSADGCDSEADLAHWVQMAMAHNATLPPAASKTARRKGKDAS